MRERKKLTADQMEINQEFLCYQIGNKCCIPWRHFIKEIKPTSIVIYDRFSYDKGEEISRDAIFEVELSTEEFNQKYYQASKEVYDILSGSEYVGDTGHHEMYNAWLGSTIQELYKNLKKEKFKLIGWFWLQDIKHGFFDDCDIGIIVENESGERFWCHYQKESIDLMCKLYIKGE